MKKIIFVLSAFFLLLSWTLCAAPPKGEPLIPKPQGYVNGQWPPAAVWEQLSLPDLSLEKNNGEISIGWNDNTNFGRYTNTFFAEAKSDKASFDKLVDLLWEKGFRGLHLYGSGRFVPARNKEQLTQVDGNGRWRYSAAYLYKGKLAFVEVGWNPLNELVAINVLDPAADPQAKFYSEMKWPKSEIKKLIGVDFPSPGGKVYGRIENDGRHIDLLIEGVSKEDYDVWFKKLKENKVPDIILDPGEPYYTISFGHESGIEYTDVSFWPADAMKDGSKYLVEIVVDYIEGALLITFNDLN